ncbi:hypothetical protein PUN4_600090 [Paraburkholderia unamae]|nr:hypothetical protein PUN4_600090 [Paraburkholderia unamae]
MTRGYLRSKVTSPYVRRAPPAEPAHPCRPRSIVAAQHFRLCPMSISQIPWQSPGATPPTKVVDSNPYFSARSRRTAVPI